MAKQAIAGLVVVGLAIGVWALWPRAGPAQSTTTTVLAGGTTIAIPETTSTTMASITTTTLATGNHVVETVEEAEEILRELWFGWFEGIYNQDEDRIREVVATEHQIALATRQFGEMPFAAPPGEGDLAYAETQILRSDEECLVVWTSTSISGFTQASTQDVHVLRWVGDAWGLFSLWAFKGDLWDGDCDARLS